MNPADEETFPAPRENRPLLLLLVAVSLALGWILLPFYGTLLWASIIALLFAPVYRRLLVRLRGRRTAARGGSSRAAGSQSPASHQLSTRRRAITAGRPPI